jgi:hypothetical protein
MLPQPQGQTMLSGSITLSTRGRCSGNARALRSLRGTGFCGSDALASIFFSTAAIRACVSAIAVSRFFQRQFHLRRIELFRFRPELVTDADAAFQDRTIEAEEHREEAVVSKDARVKEEVVLRKTEGQRTETIDDSVRHTEVEVEDGRTGQVQNSQGQHQGGQTQT